jgi:ribonuclease P protein subunit POP4
MKARSTSTELGEILMGELIGRRAEVVSSTRRELEGLEGLVVDETLNTLVLEAGGRERRVPKAQCVFRFGGVTVDGRQLLFRPEDRIKKHWRKWHGKMRGRKMPAPRRAEGAR